MVKDEARQGHTTETQGDRCLSVTARRVECAAVRALREVSILRDGSMQKIDLLMFDDSTVQLTV